MENIIQQLQSNEILVKNKTLEELLDKLQKKTNVNSLQVDAKLRLFNTTVMLLKDANPKIVLAAMECVKIFIDQYTIDFQPLVNMSFDILLVKFGDGKLTVRARANETMIALINSVGLAAGYEKLEANIHHKNMRIREQILHVLRRLFDIYRDGLLAFPNVVVKLATLLRDQQDSIRQLAVETLGQLLILRGESLMDELTDLAVRPVSLRAIQESASCGPTAQMKKEWARSPSGDKPSIDAPTPPVPTVKRGDAMSSLGSSVTNTTWSPREGSLALATSTRTKAPTTQLSRHISAGSTDIQDSVASGDISAGKFDPVWYLSLIGEGMAALSLDWQSDRELQNSLCEIKTMLRNKDDWEMRFAGLGHLQGVVGNISCSGGDSIAASIRSTVLEEVSAQISDLRSTVSKEACRTVAILARALRSSFALLAELWAPAVLKLVLVKIAVVSSAGDRCMRTVIAAGAPAGFPRLLLLLLETLTSKNPILRRHCLEYLTLAAAIWDQDSTFDRLAHGIKKAVKVGLNDADPHARKYARYLYWVLRRRPTWQRSMDSLLSDMDFNRQRDVKSERAQSNELTELLTNSATLANIDSYEPIFTGGSSVSKSFLHQEERFAQTAEQNRAATANREVRSSFNKTAPAATTSSAPSPPSKQMTRIGAARVAAASAGMSAPEVPALPFPQGGEELTIDVDDSVAVPPNQASSKHMSMIVSGRPQSSSVLDKPRRMSDGPIITHCASSPPSDSMTGSRNCAGSTDREDMMIKPMGEDISVLTCDDDYQKTVAVGEFVECSGSRDRPHSPNSYVLTPPAAVLRNPAVTDDALDITKKSTPLAPPGKDFPPEPPSTHPKRGVGRSVTPPHAQPNSDRIPTCSQKDVVWLVRTLRPECNASREDKRKAICKLKKLAKSESEEFWRRNCAQIMSVLLEAFNPPLSFVSPAIASPYEFDPAELPPAVSAPLLDGNYCSTTPHLVSSLPLTGLSPCASAAYSKSRLGNDTENVISNEQVSKSPLVGKNGPLGENDIARMEVMYIACKGLSILLKFLASDRIQMFMELIVSRLCQAASYAPTAVSLHFEQILSLMATLNPVCLVWLLLPYVAAHPSAEVVPRNTTCGKDSNQRTRLLALRALADGVKHLQSSQLIGTLPQISTIILPLFSCPLVDIRKAAVFVIVEVYMIVGDQLYPYVRDLAPSQRKLLTVYIERQMNRNRFVQSLPAT